MARAIPGHADGRALQAVLRHHRQQVGVVVLQPAQWQLFGLGQRCCQLGRRIARVLIAADGAGCEAMAATPLLQGVVQVLLPGAAAQVAEIRAEQPPARQAQGQVAFHLGTEGEGLAARGPRQRAGREPTPQPQHQGSLAGHPHNAVVDAVHDPQPMAQHPIGQLAEQGGIGAGLHAQRLTGAVGAGGHHHPAHGLQQQLVQAAGGSHHPQPGAARRHGLRHRSPALPAAAQQHDRCCRPAEDRRFLGAQLAVLVDPGAAGHQGQGFIRAPLAAAQARHGRGIAGIHQQLEAPQPLQGHDLAVLQGGDGGADAGRGGPAVALPAQLGAAAGAADGLGVETAIAGIGVLALTAGAEGKVRQAGVVALERQLLHHAVAGAAMGAADQRVAIAAVVGVVQLGQAVRADGQIGGGQGHGRLDALAGGGAGLRGRRCDLEVRQLTRGWSPVLVELVDAATGGRVLLQRCQELLQLSGWALQQHVHAAGAVADPAPELQLLRQPIQAWPKAHPLHQALDL